MNLKTCLLKNLEHTYLNEKKAANTLESLMQGEQGNADQPPRKKRCFATKSVLKSVQKQNCNSLNKCTEKSQFDGNAAITDKGWHSILGLFYTQFSFIFLFFLLFFQKTQLAMEKVLRVRAYRK